MTRPRTKYISVKFTELELRALAASSDWRAPALTAKEEAALTRALGKSFIALRDHLIKAMHHDHT